MVVWVLRLFTLVFVYNLSLGPSEVVKPKPTRNFNMEYHYQDICMPPDHMHADPYNADYSNAYVMPGQSDAEYGVRSTVVVDGGDRFGVSAVVFDKHEELVWMGNQGGHVTSYYGPSMQKYTSFQVHETEEIRDIITDEHGIYVLTKTSLRHQIRRGIPKYTHRSPNMTDMQCIFQASTTKLLMGGHQEKLVELDLSKMTETVFLLPGEDCVVLRSSGGSIVACGSANGTVTLRDIRSPGTAEHTFQAHTACLSDLDMQGNLLITCGFAHSSTGSVEAEPYVVTWDVRRLRGGVSDGGAWTSATHSPPLLLHFVPAFSGRAVAVSGDGHVALLHVNVANDVENQSVFQVDTQSSQCSVMDVSASSQSFVFGDHGGHLHLFSPQHNNEPVFNNFSRETEFADPHPNIPYSSFADTSFRFSSVPLPPLTTGNKWFNVLPESFFKKVYRKPKPIDPEVLKTMKMQGPIGYAPNPKTCRRNQMPFIEDTLDDLNSPRHIEVKNVAQPIPKVYQKVDPRFKHPQSEVDYESSNNTGLPGLDGAMTNSYCNPMLQVLYYTAPLKATLLAHTCAKEFCLSCELGFLFRMLSTSGGASCQAANFLRAFRTLPEAAALGLVLPDRRTKPDDKIDAGLLIQSWNRFILHQVHYEILETRKKEKELVLITNANSPPTRAGNVVPPTRNVATPHELDRKFDEYNFYNELEFLGPSQFDSPEEGKREDGWPVDNGHEDGVPTNEEAHPHDNGEPQSSQQAQEESEISELFAIRRHQLNRCLKCNKEEERDSFVLLCALQCPRPPAPAPPALARLLRASLSSRRSSPAWCDACRRFTPQQLHERTTRLPPILAINCGASAALEAYWSKGTEKDTHEAAKRAISKPCRYGVHCQRAGCRFKHPEVDRPISSKSSSSSKSPTAENECVLPIQLFIKLTSDGDIVINDESENSDASQSPSKDNTRRHKKHSFTETQEEYTLTAAVVCIEDNPKNLVAYVQNPGSDDEPQWYLFNDLSIIPVSVEEVVQCNAWWKTPCVLFYTSRNVLSATRNAPSATRNVPSAVSRNVSSATRNVPSATPRPFVRGDAS